MANRNTRIRGIQILDKDIDTAQIADSAIEALQLNADAVTTVKILDENVTVGKMADMGLEAHIFVADALLRPVSVAVSGDITVNASGVTAIGATKVVDSMVNDDVATGLAGTGLTAVAGVLNVDDFGDVITDDDIIRNEVLTPDTGSDTDYTLANTPVVGTVNIYWNGMLQRPGTGEDYTIDGSSIVFADAIDASDSVIADYIIT